MLEKNVLFAVDDIQRIEFSDYPDDEFAIAKVGFLSTRPNAHGLIISEDVLRACAPSALGKWMVAKMERGDATTHLSDEVIMGMIPKNQDIEFVEDSDGYLRAYADAVISKIYSKEYCAIFENDNNRAVSVEMKVMTDGEDDDNVLSFNIVGVTTLGKTVLPSCPESDVEFIRFAENEADDYFNKIHLTSLKKFAKERRIAMEKKTYKVDKSKEAMSDTEWGKVDKREMRDKIMDAENRAELVKDVYMLVEDNWEDAPSEALKYPVMELKGDTFVYNRYGLSTALAYAKQEDETEVVNKIEKIYKKLDLDDSDDGKEEKMAKEIEFAAVDIGDMWGRLYNAMDEERHWEYSIMGIYEEDNKKFAIIYDRTKNLYRLDFSLTEEGLTLADEVIKVEQEFIETDEIKKFAEPENVKDYQFAEDDDDKHDDDSDEEHDDEDEKVEMSAEEMMAKIAELEADIENRDHIIMDKDAELEELRAYKAAVVAKEMACRVDALMDEVGSYLDNEQMATFREEGLSCDESNIDAWANKVKATCFSAVKKENKKNDKGVFSFAAPIAPNKWNKTKSIWE